MINHILCIYLINSEYYYILYSLECINVIAHNYYKLIYMYGPFEGTNRNRSSTLII